MLFGCATGKELENEIEARQAQNPESLRGVHEQVIRLVDNMVQNYLANMRRAVQRFTNLIDNTRRNTSSPQPRHHQSAGAALEEDGVGPAKQLGQSVVRQLQDMTKRFREFTLLWSKTLGKQQSPLFDRIPPRGIELWRDFWDTVRKQVRRVNEEVLQMSRDMARVLTGRLPSTDARVIVRPASGRDHVDVESTNKQVAGRNLASLLYASPSLLAARSHASDEQILKQEFQDFYNKLTLQLRREEQKMAELSKAGGQQVSQQQQVDANSLIDELDDEATKQELANNVALRQQIQQEINVFGSIFDIMRTFIQRLRESAVNIRDVLQPPGAIHSNNPVTPGPDVKPTVDQILQETINSQRNINSQAKPRST